MSTIAEIYNWFMTGKKPTQAQFWASWGSFRHKDETIPQSDITNLPATLNAKAEKAQFDAHLVAEFAHSALFDAKADKEPFEEHLTDEEAHADLFAAKQATLISGENIKTINGESLLGAGDIEVIGSGGGEAGWMVSTTDSHTNTSVAYEEVFLEAVDHEDFPTGSVVEWLFWLNANGLSAHNVGVQPAIFGSGTTLSYNGLTGSFRFELSGKAIKQPDGSWEVIHELRRYDRLGLTNGDLIDMRSTKLTTPVGGLSEVSLHIYSSLVGSFEFEGGYIRQIAGAGIQGDTGDDGLSAYEIAVNNGFVGTEAEWLTSLQGEDGADGAQGIQGEQGIPGNDGADGTDGLSAYEIAVNNGFVGTEAEWLTSLQGEDGADGAQGEQGLQGIQGIPGNDGADGTDGLSAYEIAVNNGFVGTEAEWLESLHGEDGNGTDGASAYEIAVNNGFVGTEVEWLASLQGEDGNGADGASAYEIAVNNGFVGTEVEWLASLQGEAGADGETNTINSVVAGEPTGAGVIPNIVYITQANYDAAVTAGTIVATTLYVINDA